MWYLRGPVLKVILVVNASIFPARDTDAVSVEESLRLSCAHHLCCDSIQAATCILMNEDHCQIE